MEAPSGTIAFLFTDVIGSTGLWARDRDGMSASLRAHDELVRAVVRGHGGYVFATGGDGFCISFPSATAGIDAALALQDGLGLVVWPGPVLRVRIGVHLGDAEERDGDYFGPVVNIAARVMGAAHGGQILITDAVQDAAGLGNARSIGRHRLRGVDGDIGLHQVGPGDFPPPESGDVDTATVRFGRFELDLAGRGLMADGERVHLEPQVFDVLAYLLKNRDRLVPREELLDEVWGDQFVSLSALTSRIKAARQALGDDGRSQSFIRTERGRGYQFIAQLESVDGDDHPTAPATLAPAPKSTHRRSAAIPRAQGPILGRGRELAELADLLNSANLVTLVGPGGVGKTRTAVELASRWQDDLGRPVEYVALDMVREPDQVERSLATTLGIDAPPQGELVAACAQSLGGANQLLVLDNCEHLLDVIAAITADLLALSPALVVLATSREPLRLHDEHIYRLATLDVPSLDAGFTIDSPGPCLELFSTAARRADARFQLDQSNVDDVADLCRRLDGLPLAVELAAGRLGSLGIDDLRRTLGDQLDMIRANTGDQGDRQRSLRSTVEWSLRLLDQEALEAFGLLSAFPAGLTLEDIESYFSRFGSSAVVGDLICQLVDASMIVRDTTVDETRYRMLETLREAGQEEMARLGLEEEANFMLAEHALSATRDLPRVWMGGDMSDVPTQRVVCREIPNLRAARGVMIDSGDIDGIVGLSSRLLAVTEEACLAELWSWHEGLDGMAAERSPDVSATAKMLAAALARNQGRLDDATQLAEEARSLSDDPWVQSRCLHALAMVLLFSGDPVQAAEKWLEEVRLIGDCRSQLFAAMCHAFIGEIEAADELLAGCSAAFEDADHAPAMVNANFVAGEVSRIAGRASARDLLQTGVDLAREHELWFSWGVTQVSLASILAESGDKEEAAQSYIELIERWVRSATWPQFWTTLRNVAELLGSEHDGVCLMIWVAAAEDAQAPALDEQASIAAAQAVEGIRTRLGTEPSDEIERVALRTSRVDLAGRVVDALVSLQLGS